MSCVVHCAHQAVSIMETFRLRSPAGYAVLKSRVGTTIKHQTSYREGLLIFKTAPRRIIMEYTGILVVVSVTIVGGENIGT